MSVALPDIPINETPYRFPPKFEFIREPQYRYALEAEELFRSGIDVVIMQAATGFGKGLAATAVAQGLGIPILYLAPHLTLQDQIIKELGPSPTNACNLSGRANYEHGGDRGHQDFFRGITCADCRNRSLCNGNGCAYKAARNTFLLANFRVTNLAYFMTAANYLRMFQPGVPPTRYPAVYGDYLTVVDEACLLRKEILNFLDVEISVNRIQELCTYINVTPPKIPIGDHALWPGWYMDMDDIIEKCVALAKSRPIASDDLPAIRWVNGLERLKASWKQVEWDWVYQPKRKLNDASGRQTGEPTSVLLRPIRVSELGKRYFWDHCGKVLCISATFCSEQVFVEETGLDKAGKTYRYIDIPSDWDWKRAPIFQIRGANVVQEIKRKPWREQPCFEPLLKNCIKILDKYPQDRAVIHTVSHNLAGDLGLRLIDRFGKQRIIVHYGDSMDRQDKRESVRARAATLEKLRKIEGGVLVSASVMRGIDLPDNMCRNNIVAKCPMANPTDPVMQAILRSPGGQLLYDVWTIRELLQAVGRSLRSGRDWARTFILDEQFWKLIQLRGLIPQYWMKRVKQPGDLYWPFEASILAESGNTTNVIPPPIITGLDPSSLLHKPAPSAPLIPQNPASNLTTIFQDIDDFLF